MLCTGLEDKATACTMLVCYARELKEHFVDYAEETVRLMVRDNQKSAQPFKIYR